MFFVFLVSICNLYYIDKRLNEIFIDYLDVEVKSVCNNIISNAINNYISKEKYNDFLVFDNTVTNDVDKISYNTEKINQFSSNFSKYLDDILSNIDSGSLENYNLNSRVNKYHFTAIKNGIVCNISLGSINKSILFSSFGPKIPVKIVFTGNISTDVDIQIEEYGINNAIIKIYLVISIKEQATLPLTSKENDIVIREPVAVDIIRGEIPKYYGFVN